MDSSIKIINIYLFNNNIIVNKIKILLQICRNFAYYLFSYKFINNISKEVKIYY